MAFSSTIRTGTATVAAVASSRPVADFAGFDISKRQVIRTPQTRFDRIG
jgi:hypothetical protein